MMFAKMNAAMTVVISTSDGTQKMQEYAWKTLREVTRDVRVADGWFDFIPCNVLSPAFGFHSGGTSVVIDAVAGTVTEVQNPDIPMDADALALAVKAQKIEALAALTAKITDRMWEEESVASTLTFPLVHDPLIHTWDAAWVGLTATQAIALINAEKAAIRATL